QARSRERRKLEKLVDGFEADIARLEAKQGVLTTELEDPATYQKPGRAVAVNRDLQYILEDLGRVTKEWEDAASRLEALT
ncbi:MAG: ABC transporter ATP-binding protein, partial [Verrucomicrobia bacterium]|nr:ABC transporter ATP-binding protein [Verrucomicrobiota bacterium]